MKVIINGTAIECLNKLRVFYFVFGPVLIVQVVFLTVFDFLIVLKTWVETVTLNA